MNEEEISAGMAQTPGYRYAERVGGRLFVAGQVPLNRNAELVGVGNPAEQASQCLRNLGVILKTHGFGEQDIRHLVVYVAGDRDEMDSAWSSVVTWFGKSVPPATLLGVTMLGYEKQLVELDATIVAVPAAESIRS